MPAANSSPPAAPEATLPPPLVDIARFVAEQRAERYRAFIVHGPPLAGKSTFARRLASTQNGVYLDVLALVAGDEELAARVDTLDTAWLDALVRAQVKGGARLIVMDEFDFLWPLWGDDLAPLLRAVDRFYSEEIAVVAWVMPSHRALEPLSSASPLLRADGGTRVLRLDEIGAL